MVEASQGVKTDKTKPFEGGVSDYNNSMIVEDEGILIMASLFPRVSVRRAVIKALALK